MIKFSNVEVSGWKSAIRGMRNPMNSWSLSDSTETQLGDRDKELMLKLVGSGHPSHSKFRRMILVSMDIDAPLYWWKEYDTYKVGTVANSCSTMHKIHEKEFVLDDFSHEHLVDDEVGEFLSDLEGTVVKLNRAREAFLRTKDKKYWWQMIQLLPTSYNQLRTVLLNYEVLANILMNRKNHKLDEWRDFCDLILLLPHSEIIERSIG